MKPSSTASRDQAAGMPGAARAVWLKRLHQWHWISAAVAMVGIFCFSLTSITLNHASQIEAMPTVVSQKALVAAPALVALRSFAQTHDGAHAPLPEAARSWLMATWAVNADAQVVDWSRDEVYLALPRPGGDAWLRVS